MTGVPALVRAYTDGEEPWCLLDTHHRHLETRKYNFDFAADGEQQGLDKLIAKAEHRYMEVGSALAKNFVTAYKMAQHPIKGILRQRDLFKLQVKPMLGDGRIAYVWVDALRFEMARELCLLLKTISTMPSSLPSARFPLSRKSAWPRSYPRADQSAKVVGVGGGKLGLEIEGRIVKDRKDRVGFLNDNAGVTVFDCKVDDLIAEA